MIQLGCIGVVRRNGMSVHMAIRMIDFVLLIVFGSVVFAMVGRLVQQAVARRDRGKQPADAHQPMRTASSGKR